MLTYLSPKPCQGDQHIVYLHSQHPSLVVWPSPQPPQTLVCFLFPFSPSLVPLPAGQPWKSQIITHISQLTHKSRCSLPSAFRACRNQEAQALHFATDPPTLLFSGLFPELPEVLPSCFPRSKRPGRLQRLSQLHPLPQRWR